MVRWRSGFALIELTVIVGFLGILFVIVMSQVTANNSRAGNVQRRADVNGVLSAIESYVKDHGTVPDGVTDQPKLITSTLGPGTVDLCKSLVPNYISTIPLDPGTGLAVPVGTKCNSKNARYSSGYTVQTTTDHKVLVNAPAADDDETIFASN